MTREEIAAFLARAFPEIAASGRVLTVEEVRPLGARVRMAFVATDIRPGGTISGPAMFLLADLAMFVAVLGAVGPQALAVTTSITINFLRRPSPGDLIAEVRLIKLGRRLVVGEIALYPEPPPESSEPPPGTSQPPPEMVAHATATYSIPPGDGGGNMG